MKIAHIHVWDKTNKGDLAIVISVQDLLRKLFKDCEIVDIPVDQLKLGEKEWLDTINTCDLVAIGGGGIYYSYFLPYDLEFIENINPPIAIIGVGYIKEFGSDPIPNESIQSIIALNNKATYSSVRDINTFNFLRDNGYKGDVSVIGDPAVLLEETPTEFTPGKVSVGFNLNYSGWMGFGKYQDAILTAYNESIALLKKNYDADIYYLVHHPGEYTILKKLIGDVKIIDVPPKQQKYIYSKLNVVVGMMLHSVVMAFGAGTPVVSVAYDVRNKGFMEYIGQEEFLILPEDISAELLFDKIKTLLDDNANYRTKSAIKSEEIKQETNNYLQSILADINSKTR